MSPHFPPRPKRECIRTSITREIPSDTNPFVAARSFYHGYDAEAIVGGYVWHEALFLLLRGDLPTTKEARLLNLLMTSLINPGPRDAAVRAAMNCGIGKTPVATILATGITVRGGMTEGALCVEMAMRFFAGQLPSNPARDPDSEEYARVLVEDYRRFQNEDPARDMVPLPEDPPGLGLHYDDRDQRAVALRERAGELGHTGEYIALASGLEDIIGPERGIYLTQEGVAAALLCDLGFSPAQGAGVFLIAGSAGILAHGVEQLPRRWNEFPFWADPKYYHYTGPEPTKKVEDSL